MYVHKARKPGVEKEGAKKGEGQPDISSVRALMREGSQIPPTL